MKQLICLSKRCAYLRLTNTLTWKWKMGKIRPMKLKDIDLVRQKLLIRFG